MNDVSILLMYVCAYMLVMFSGFLAGQPSYISHKDSATFEIGNKRARSCRAEEGTCEVEQ